LDEERTHQIAVDLDDNAGVIDLFITITGIAPLSEAINDSEISSNIALDIIPSKLTDEDIENYVCIQKTKRILFVLLRNIHFIRVFYQHYDQ
jgi:hypothetical protein